jgi:hypothetical protein
MTETRAGDGHGARQRSFARFQIVKGITPLTLAPSPQHEALFD